MLHATSNPPAKGEKKSNPRPMDNVNNGKSQAIILFSGCSERGSAEASAVSLTLFLLFFAKRGISGTFSTAGGNFSDTFSLSLATR